MSVNYEGLADAIRTEQFPGTIPKPLLVALSVLDSVQAARAEIPSFAVQPERAALGMTVEYAPMDFARQLAERLVEGEPLPDDLPDAAYAAVLADAKQRATSDVLIRVEPAVERAFDSAARDATPQLLQNLRSAFDVVLADVRATVDALEGYDVTATAQLVTARDGIREAYAALPEKIDAYDAIRRLQYSLQGPDIAARPNGSFWSDIRHAGWFEVRDVPRLWPNWQLDIMGERQRNAPWPTDSRARIVRVLQLDPWMPSVEEALVAIDEHLQPTMSDRLGTAGGMADRNSRELALTEARRVVPGAFLAHQERVEREDHERAEAQKAFRATYQPWLPA